MPDTKPITSIHQIIPGGGNWTCVFAPGAITRSVMWGRIEVALVNPNGDLDDGTEGNVAMGLTAMPAVCMALRMIRDRVNPDSEAGQIARLAIEYIERPAPRLVEPDDDEHETSDEETA